MVCRILRITLTPGFPTVKKFLVLLLLISPTSFAIPPALSPAVVVPTVSPVSVSISIYFVKQSRSVTTKKAATVSCNDAKVWPHTKSGNGNGESGESAPTGEKARVN